MPHCGHCLAPATGSQFVESDHPGGAKIKNFARGKLLENVRRFADFAPFMPGSRSATRSFQRQPALMPTVRAAAENSDTLETGG